MAEKTTKKRTITSQKAARVTAKPKKEVKSTRAKKATSTAATKTAAVTSEVKSPKAVRIRKSYFLTFLGLLILVAAIVLSRSLFIAAVVNQQPISRLAVIRELEKQGGKQALDSLITKTLIVQKAKEKNVTVEQKEVDGELKKIEANLAEQGQKLDQVLQLQGMTKEQLVEQIRLQKMIEKMIGKITVSEKEVNEYIEANKDSLPQDQEQAKLVASVQERLQQQKLNERAQKFLEDIRNEAKITFFVNY